MSDGHRPGAEERAGLLLDLGRHAEARREVEAALAAEPDSASLHGLRSRALDGLGEHGEALASAERVTALLPGSAAGHRQRAVALLRLGRTPEALAAAQETVRLEPQHWPHHALLAQVAADDPRSLRLAWGAALHAVSLAPEQADTHFSVGFVASRRRDHRTAVTAYERALAIHPGHATALHNLALERGGDLSQQARGVGAALRLDPQRADFRASLDRVVRRTLVAAWLAALVALLLGVGASADSPADQVVVLPAALGLVGVVAWLAITLHRLPVGVRRHAVAYVRGRAGTVLLLLATTVGLTALAATAALPGRLAPGLVGAPLSLLVGLVGVGVTHQRRDR
ncbi:tetratricopeptide repeat protein [uncultured Nocardioides sp.]|uniref:tetratricopeptide repeat protein n=1 Tax=uncultured Nocardioides sp. TaxID=198441 RepID=UPI00261C459F|nr:tetratricopeptide repeat protein [uncultured Nocardioides sp.]